MKLDNNTPITPSFGMSMRKPRGESLKRMNAYFRKELAITPFHKLAYREFCLKQHNNKYYDIYFKPAQHGGLIQSNDAFVVTPKNGVLGKPIEVPCVASKYGTNVDKTLVYRDDKYQRFLEAHPIFGKHKILKVIAALPYAIEDFATIAKSLVARPENLLPDALRQASKIAKNMEKIESHFINI